MRYAQESFPADLLFAIRTILNPMNESTLVRVGCCWFLVLAILLVTPFYFAFADTPSGCPYSWGQNLKVGSTGSDVLALQKFLNSNPETLISDSGAGSPGNESNTFGPRTKTAVIKFQEKYASEILIPAELSKGTGTVGIGTRAKLNSLCVLAVTPPAPKPTPESTGQVAAGANAVAPIDVLAVSDPGQSGPTLIPASATLPVLAFTLSAGSKNVVVREITIERTGLGSDGAFLNFGLWDEQDLQIGNVAAFNSLHRAVFRKPFTISAGTSQTLAVLANANTSMTNYDGQRPVIQLVGVNATSPVSGGLPLRGSLNTVNSSLIVGGADATLSQYDPGVAITRYINDKNIKFAGIRITARSPEDITLTNIIWTQSGTVGGNDITNINTVVNDTKYPASVSPYSEKEYVSYFEPGIVIKKGNTIDVYVQGDVLPSAANRTVEFDIRDINDEVSLVGNTYGFSVWLSPKGNTGVAGSHSAFITSDGTTDGTTGTPFFAGPIITVSGGAETSIGKN